MQQNLENTIALLERMPATLNALLRGLPDFWTMQSEGQIEGKETWSALNIVAHLIDAERVDWIPRVRMILEHGESRAFEPFERDGHKREGFGRTLPELLDVFQSLRLESLNVLQGMDLETKELMLRGRHPAFGVVTLSELLATWAAHDLTHLHQLSRVMAYQYRDAVGPWVAYLGALQCKGHSAP